MEYFLALIVLAATTVPVAHALGRHPDAAFLKKVFLGAVAARAAVGLAIYVFNAQSFFGADAETYDGVGEALADVWRAGVPVPEWLAVRLSTKTSGWGMYYWVAGIYTFTGPSQLVIQAFNVVLSAIVPVLIFFIAEIVYRNRMVSERAALLSAFFPSVVLWSAQALKDPLILLAMCVVVYGALRLREGVTFRRALLVGAGLFVLYALRFYAFYIMAAALAVSMLMGSVKDVAGFAKQCAVAAVLGTVLLYFGVGRQAVEHFEAIDLQKIQADREWSASVSESGFGGDIDVTDEGGTSLAIGVGIVYLMLAPFPWQIANLRQAVTVPEMLVWWAMLPLLVSGVWYTIRYRLSDSSMILIFTAGLMLVYGLYLSNVGTAYRQRAQILVFFFLFVAVGFTLRTVKKQSRARERFEPAPGPRRARGYAA